MPASRPSRPSRSDARSTTKSGYGKRNDQGRGAAKRTQDTPSGRSTRRRDAEAFTKREEPKMAPARKNWGSVTRKGAATINERGRASSREDERAQRARDNDDARWVPEKKQSKKRTEEPPAERPRFVIPEDAIKEIEQRSGKRSERLLRYLKDAGTAYASERFPDAKKALRPLLQETPDAPIVQELHGMVLYRLGSWAPAVKELRAAHTATRSFDLYPALMDCHRALNQYKQVEILWDELRAESPSAEVMAEGRIVMAGALRDQGREQDAIRLMEKGPRPKANIQSHHVRSWYVLADLYDAVGETGKARSLFQKVAKHEPDLADVQERIEALG